jgi:cytochrome c peroxidase
VVRRIIDSYKEAYEDAFGSLPALLRHVELPAQGLPAAEAIKLPIETASQGLSTLTGRGLLLDILNQSQEKRVAPAMELSRQVLETPRPDLNWIQSYEMLEDDVKSAVDHVFAKVGQALASYQRQIVSSPSRFDLFASHLASGKTIEQAMTASSFSEQELIGFKLFVGPGRCVECHAGPGFSDQKFHNIGLSYVSGPIPMGRALGALQTLGDVFNCYSGAFPSETMPTSDETGRCPALETIDVTSLDQVGAFKTPSLRNVAMTSPYMHDGRFSNLEQVLEIYSHFEEAPGIGKRDPLLEPRQFTREEAQALTAFLASLTSPFRDITSEAKVSLVE